MAMFDINDSLSQPSQSFYDLFLKNRQSMPPDIAQQMPTLGANTPGQRMDQAQQQAPVADLASTIQQVAGPLAQASAGPNAKPKEIQDAGSGIAEVLSSIDPLKPLPSYGPQGFGRALGMPENAGGILGLGVQPIDILGFALGAALGRGQSPEAAMKTAMWGASLPREFRNHQEKRALEFVQAKQAEYNSQIAGGNLLERQNESIQRQAITARKNAILDWTTRRLATGQPLTAAERMQLASQAHGIFDPNFIKEFVITPDFATQANLIQQAQTFAKDNGMGSVSATIDAPGAMKLTLGNPAGSSGRAVVTGELVDSLQTGKVSEKMQAAGFGPTDAQTPEGRAKIEAAIKGRQALETQRIGIAQGNQNIARANLEQLRPEESKKLEAFSELHHSASDMLTKYEASLASHGGKMSPSLLLAMKGATNSPDGYLGASINSIAQRHPDLTEADREFITRYASMQKFARGILQDVGNLSNFERGLVSNITGTPLDVPAQFRSRSKTTIEDVARAYGQARSAMGARDVSMFPEALGAGPSGKTKKEVAAPQGGELSKQGNAFLQELKKAMNK